ncbi:hypothetical protein N8I77_013249 [Diaporthe amygdali]|uniref:Peptidase S8/S53 domain-containing protein n=1 Tax=Phomopsis amygdali TaxID=1214568 RepID=A0AAD9S162_PHOAM|nr:hypothetical protein N8I77_013249 [Diaporthe amygdali]
MGCKSPSNLLQFAEKITSILLKYCFTLNQDESTKRFSRKLTAELYPIQDWLRENSDDPRIDGDKVQRRVQSLLRKFEDICKWNPRDEAGKDGEKASKEQPRHMIQGRDISDFRSGYEWALQDYPTLFGLLDPKTTVACGLKSYASQACPEDQTLRLGILRKFVKGEKHVEPQIEDVEEDPPLEDYAPHIRRLHEAVSKHCLCQRSTEPEDPIVANIHLGWQDEESSTDESSSDESSSSDASSSASSAASSASNPDPPINFHVLFVSHPHGPVSSNITRWRDTRIAVPPPKKVMWKGRQARSKKAKLINEHEDGFCGLISSPEPVWHPLVFDEGQLRFKDARRYSRTFQLDTPSISLKDIVRLPREHFTEKKRFVLSYLLARAVWQYYDSDWMIRGWTKDAVHFMYETRDDESGLFVDEPFLHTVSFTSGGNDDSDVTKQVHKFPKMLALGIMLIEINLGIRIEDERTPKSYVDGKLTANADAIIAEDISNNKKRLREYPGHLTSAIRFCTNPRKVVKKLSSKKAPEQREHLYKHVVAPLRRLCEWSFNKELSIAAIDLPVPATLLHPQSEQRTELVSGTDELESPFSTHLHPEDIRRQSADDVGPEFRYLPGPEIPFKSNWQHPSLNGTMLQSGLGTSDEWFSQLGELNKVLRAKGTAETDEQHEPVKVAVLDTGILKDNYTKHSKSIKKYRDYVTDKETSPTDTSGSIHGTHIVELVLKTFKDAHIYVARVFEQEKLHDDDQIEEAQSRIAKAVQDATDAWKVDVIAMAFGFEKEHDDMLKAIGDARANNILVFAAASNYGNMTRIAFPARLHHEVMCMFCTNARAKTSQGINPKPSRNRAYNLAIFGEEVRLPGPRGDAVLLNGTSMSTAIGAGLAARLIDFSRHRDCRRNFGKEAADLKRMAGMESVFAKMAGGPSGDGYYCVVPWNLLNDIGRGETRESMRAAICSTIKVALRERSD